MTQKETYFETVLPVKLLLLFMSLMLARGRRTFEGRYEVATAHRVEMVRILHSSSVGLVLTRLLVSISTSFIISTTQFFFELQSWPAVLPLQSFVVRFLEEEREEEEKRRRGV